MSEDEESEAERQEAVQRMWRTASELKKMGRPEFAKRLASAVAASEPPRPTDTGE